MVVVSAVKGGALIEGRRVGFWRMGGDRSVGCREGGLLLLQAVYFDSKRGGVFFVALLIPMLLLVWCCRSDRLLHLLLALCAQRYL